MRLGIKNRSHALTWCSGVVAGFIVAFLLVPRLPDHNRDEGGKKTEVSIPSTTQTLQKWNPTKTSLPREEHSVSLLADPSAEFQLLISEPDRKERVRKLTHFARQLAAQMGIGGLEILDQLAPGQDRWEIMKAFASGLPNQFAVEALIWFGNSYPEECTNVSSRLIAKLNISEPKIAIEIAKQVKAHNLQRSLGGWFGGTFSETDQLSELLGAVEGMSSEFKSSAEASFVGPRLSETALADALSINAEKLHIRTLDKYVHNAVKSDGMKALEWIRSINNSKRQPWLFKVAFDELLSLDTGRAASLYESLNVQLEKDAAALAFYDYLTHRGQDDDAKIWKSKIATQDLPGRFREAGFPENW